MDALVVCGIWIASVAALAAWCSRPVDPEKERRREKDEWRRR